MQSHEIEYLDSLILSLIPFSTGLHILDVFSLRRMNCCKNQLWFIIKICFKSDKNKNQNYCHISVTPVTLMCSSQV